MIKDITLPESATCRRTAQHVIQSHGCAHDAVARRTRTRRSAMFAIAVLLGCSWLAFGARPARASDFWDELRTPGLAAQRAHLRRGREALLAGHPQLALTEADAALVRCASCADGAVLRGRALAALGRHAQATACFEQAIVLRPQALDDDTLDASTAAFSAGSSGRPAFAMTILERLLARGLDPQTRARATVMLADALQSQGPATLRRAIVTYREAVVDDSVRTQAVLGLALAIDREGEHQEALALARAAGADTGSDATSRWLPDSEREARRGLWLSSIGDVLGAEQAWTRAAQSEGVWQAHARASGAVARRAVDRP